MSKKYCENKGNKHNPETTVNTYSEKKFFKRCRKIMRKFYSISVNDPVANAHNNKQQTHWNILIIYFCPRGLKDQNHN